MRNQLPALFVFLCLVTFSVVLNAQTPLTESLVVQDVPGYNSWPVIQALGKKLVCIYSRGTGHSIGEGVRGVWARTSEDGGKTWSPETLVANSPDWGEVTIGKGLDENGALLVWIRRCGKGIQHDLYRSTDGVNYELISTPHLDPMPMQITDVFSVPTVGLMALWFQGNYGDSGPCHAWGTVVSTDNGKTWTQNIIEKEISKDDWPTEQAAVYLGDGKILAVARVETGKCQKQLISTDYGKTWTCTDTNIADCMASTPSLILDPKTGLLSNYYYHRGKGILRRRVVKPEDVFENSTAWPDSEVVCLGSEVPWDSGNVNATVIDGIHYCAFYTGKAPDTSVVIAAVPAPMKGAQ